MSAKAQILVVEDEKDLSELLVYNLERAGYAAVAARSGRRALDLIASSAPDLIILDLMLPEVSGTEIASRVRANPRTSTVPIIMLTAKGTETDQVMGLAIGADDYISKPFSMKVLLARVEAVLRRSAGGTGEDALLRMGPVIVNLATHEVESGGEAVKLTLTEFRILAALMQASGRVLARSILMAKAMGPGVTVTERTIDVHVTAIRRKLGVGASIIRTVRGVGYRASAEASAEDEVEAGESAGAAK